ncbi:hypothetical protein BASA81_011036 [Batrachochytrium salamandrivorans]|nr:hypothetical protein BASA81_011036 [Batrachochytrium salamandrivorans]
MNRLSLVLVFAILLGVWTVSVGYIYLRFFLHRASFPPSNGLRQPLSLPPPDKYEYWKFQPSLSLSFHVPPRLSPTSYVTFEDDAGGWNNMRMAFECFVLVAKLTGRTLVLPPRARFYLLDSGPIKLFRKPNQTSSSSSYGDYFDLDALRTGGEMEIITTDEFIARMRIANPPRDATPNVGEWSSNGHHLDWFLYLRARPDTIIWPTGPNLVRSSSQYAFETLAYLDDLPGPEQILHFPVHLSQNLRYLDGAPGLMRKAHPDIVSYSKQFLCKHLRYTPAILQAVKLAVKQLGGAGKYSCLHVRRNDLQYGASFLGAEESLRNVRPRLLPGELLYLATDEVQQGFFDVFESEGFPTRKLRNLLYSTPSPLRMDGWGGRS